jgi:DNA invertase Pin-like site-specific DNA recombinase
MRACGYVRVSTTETGRGCPMEWMKRIMEEKATEQQVSILQWFEDTADGALPLADRPNGVEMLDEVEKRGYDTVVVWSMDRLGRTRTVAEAGVEAINRRGASVRVLSEVPVASNVLTVDRA